MERGARPAKAKAEGRPSGTRKSGKRDDSSASRISVNVLGDANGNSLFAGVSEASETSKDPTGIPEPGTLALVLATPSTAGARTRMDQSCSQRCTLRGASPFVLQHVHIHRARPRPLR
jgi:hypothetical protein